MYASTGSPAVELTINLAENLAKEEGYNNAKQAIENLLGY